MKHLTFAFVTLSSLTLIFTACSKKNEAGEPAPAAAEEAPAQDPAVVAPTDAENKPEPAVSPAPKEGDEAAEAEPMADQPTKEKDKTKEDSEEKTEGGEEEAPTE